LSVINVEQNKNNNFKQVDAEAILNGFGRKDADRLRMDITRSRKLDNEPPIRCGVCKEPVYIRANPLEDNSYHFSHFKTDNPILKKCVQRTEHKINIELIRALKYQGAKESLLHYRLKHLIAGLLNRDETIDKGSVLIESTLLREKEWRKPDVQAVHDGNFNFFQVLNM